MRSRLLLLTVMIFAGAGMRLLPHPHNFEPIEALALFAGAGFANKRWAFALPLAALLMSDAVLGFYPGMPVVYGAFALIVCLGFWLRERRRLLPVAASTLAASILFFVVTNFGVWLFDGLYPRTIEGLIACYVAAIPFFGNSLAGTAFYAVLLFGGLSLAERKIPVFAPAGS